MTLSAQHSPMPNVQAQSGLKHLVKQPQGHRLTHGDRSAFLLQGNIAVGIGQAGEDMGTLRPTGRCYLDTLSARLPMTALEIHAARCFLDGLGRYGLKLAHGLVTQVLMLADRLAAEQMEGDEA